MQHNTFIQRIEKEIQAQGLIQPGDRVLLGFSGGPDSLCLFHVLTKIQRRGQFSLEVVHVNHGLRPGDAEEDQAFVEAMCQEEKVPCQVYQVDCLGYAKEHGLTTEEAGRILRYACFQDQASRPWNEGEKEVRIFGKESSCPAGKEAQGQAPQKRKGQGIDASQYRPVKVALAQNQDDQVETLLLRILRGTGVDGLGGMSPARKEGENMTIIRPLLEVTRKEIEAYLTQEGLQPRQDATNQETVYTRNRIRHQLLPFLEENYNPGIRQALVRTAHLAQEDKAFLLEEGQKRYANLLLEKKKEFVCLCRTGFQKEPEAMQGRILRQAFQDLGLVQDLEYKHILQGKELIQRHQKGELHYPQGYRLQVDSRKVWCWAPTGDFGEEPQEKAQEKKPLPALRCWVEPAGCFPEGRKAPAGKQQIVFDAQALRRWVEEENLDKKQEGPKNPGESPAQRKVEASWEALLQAIEVRYRKPGDRLKIKIGKGQIGNKRLQNIFVDDKIPASLRDAIPLVAIREQVLWMPSPAGKERQSAGWGITPATEQVLVLEMDRNV